MFAESFPVQHRDPKKKEKFGLGIALGHTTITEVNPETNHVTQSFKVIVAWEDNNQACPSLHDPSELDNLIDFAAWAENYFNNDDGDDGEDDDEMPSNDLTEDDLNALANEVEGLSNAQELGYDDDGESEIVDEEFIDDETVEAHALDQTSVHNPEVVKKFRETTV